MKKATLLALVISLSSIMFAGVNVTWGNAYTDNDGTINSASSFGVWFDVNDATAVGWENGLKVSMAGPASSSIRLGYDSGTTLGVGWNMDTGGGTGWGTTLGTAIDFTLTDEGAAATDAKQGDFSILINLGFGF